MILVAAIAGQLIIGFPLSRRQERQIKKQKQYGGKHMTNKEIAQKVVDRMVEEINKGGSLPWVKPWDNGGAP